MLIFLRYLRHIVLSLSFVLIMNLNGFSSPESSDSLIKAISACKEDSNKVNLLLKLASNQSAKEGELSMETFQNAFNLSKKLNWLKGIIYAEFGIADLLKNTGDLKGSIERYRSAIEVAKQMFSRGTPEQKREGYRFYARLNNNLGMAFFKLSDLSSAKLAYNESLKMAESIKDSVVMKKVLENSGVSYRASAEYETAIAFFSKSMNLSWTLKDSLSYFRNFENIAFTQYCSSNYTSAITTYASILKQVEKLKDKSWSVRIFNAVGTIYNEKGDFPNALNYYFKCVKLAETISDERQIAQTYANIGNVFMAQSDYQKALTYHFKALKSREAIGDKLGQSICLGNIGNVFFENHELDKALEYQTRCLKLSEDIADWEGVAIAMGNLGNIHYRKKDLGKAIDYFEKSLKLKRELDDKQGIAITLTNLGTFYFDQKNFPKAEKCMLEALQMSIDMGADNIEKECRSVLSELYEKTGRSGLALIHFKKFISLRDSIFSQENSKKSLKTEMDHEYEKKKAVADAEHKVQIENQKLVAAEKTKKQNIIIATVIGGLVLVMIFAGFIFRSLRITSKQKLIIEQKNKETEHQKMEIEEKQKEILDSIHYAKKIQMAQIPSEKRVGIILQKLRKT